MRALIIRFQFSNFAGSAFMDQLKQRYGGALNYIAEGTILLETNDTAEEIFEFVSPNFTYDDKLFIAEVVDFKSLHKVNWNSSVKNSSINKVS